MDLSAYVPEEGFDLPPELEEAMEQIDEESSSHPVLSVDFSKELRQKLGLICHLQVMAKREIQYQEEFQKACRPFFSEDRWAQLRQLIHQYTDDYGHFHHSARWKMLFQELRAAAALQSHLQDKNKKQDPFQEYAAIYDAVIGRPCLENFMGPYLRYCTGQMGGLTSKRILSLGCGTGLVESFMLEELAVTRENLLGIDISEGMIREAGKRIPARQQDLLTMDTTASSWQLVYSGLNVFHYLPFGKMEKAIQKAASLLGKSGYFLGDFITPDHIRWYPNVIVSAGEHVISLRNPELIEVEGAMFQESEIFNLHYRDGELLVHYVGKHRRFLPPMHRVRSYFEKYFREVRFFDAYSLQELPDRADTCPSTRYVILAKK